MVQNSTENCCQSNSKNKNENEEKAKGYEKEQKSMAKNKQRQIRNHQERISAFPISTRKTDFEVNFSEVNFVDWKRASNFEKTFN